MAEQERQSFADLFMLNNGNYILQSARKFKYSEAIQRTGFLKDMEDSVRRYTKSYVIFYSPLPNLSLSLSLSLSFALRR